MCRSSRRLPISFDIRRARAHVVTPHDVTESREYVTIRHDRSHDVLRQDLCGSSHRLHGCLANTLYPSPNSFHNLLLRLSQVFAHIKDILVGYLNRKSINCSFKRADVEAHLGMRLKGLAILNEPLPLIRRPFQLANLYQLGTDFSDLIDSTRTQIFNVLNELRKLHQGIPRRDCSTYHTKFVDTNDRSILEALRADQEHK